MLVVAGRGAVAAQKAPGLTDAPLALEDESAAVVADDDAGTHAAALPTHSDTRFP